MALLERRAIVQSGHVHLAIQIHSEVAPKAAPYRRASCPTSAQIQGARPPGGGPPASRLDYYDLTQQ
jgi:hypothetical protein